MPKLNASGSRSEECLEQELEIIKIFQYRKKKLLLGIAIPVLFGAIYVLLNYIFLEQKILKDVIVICIIISCGLVGFVASKKYVCPRCGEVPRIGLLRVALNPSKCSNCGAKLKK